MQISPSIATFPERVKAYPLDDDVIFCPAGRIPSKQDELRPMWNCLGVHPAKSSTET
jgi:hypothetical protein